MRNSGCAASRARTHSAHAAVSSRSLCAVYRTGDECLNDLPGQLALWCAARFQRCAQRLLRRCFAIEADPSDLLRRRERAPLQGMRHSIDQLAARYPALPGAILLKCPCPATENFRLGGCIGHPQWNRSAGRGCGSSPAAHRHRGRAAPCVQARQAKTS